MTRRHLFLLLGFLLLAACATTPDPQVRQQEYTEAMQAVKNGRYDTAIERLESLRDSAEAEAERYKMETSLAYALYKKGEYDSALKLAEDIIRRYPPQPQQAYVHYLRGLIALKMGEAEQQRLLESEHAPDAYPRKLRTAYRYFTELIRQFPRSTYTEQAYKHLAYIRQLLAEYEVHQIQRLMMHKQYAEAIDRARYVADNFDDTPGYRQALELAAKAHEALGQKDEAALIRRRLEDLERR